MAMGQIPLLTYSRITQHLRSVKFGKRRISIRVSSRSKSASISARDRIDIAHFQRIQQASKYLIRKNDQQLHLSNYLYFPHQDISLKVSSSINRRTAPLIAACL
jgi:hypothetical protein